MARNSAASHALAPRAADPVVADTITQPALWAGRERATKRPCRSGRANSCPGRRASCGTSNGIPRSLRRAVCCPENSAARTSRQARPVRGRSMLSTEYAKPTPRRPAALQLAGWRSGVHRPASGTTIKGVAVSGARSGGCKTNCCWIDALTGWIPFPAALPLFASGLWLRLQLRSRLRLRLWLWLCDRLLWEGRERQCPGCSPLPGLRLRLRRRSACSSCSDCSSLSRSAEASCSDDSMVTAAAMACCSATAAVATDGGCAAPAPFCTLVPFRMSGHAVAAAAAAAA